MKRFISAFAVLVLILICMSACNAGSDADTFITAEGMQYIVVRDDDGNIVINDNGKLQVFTVNENGKKQKNDNGEYITEYIDFNGQVVIDKTVETAEMKFDLPKNFVADDNNPGYFYNENYDAEIFISYYDSGIDKAIIAAESNCESLLESYGSEVFEYNKYTVNVNDIECTAFKHRCTSSEYYKNAFMYYIPYDTGYYVINCVISTDNENKIDFDRFIEKLELK